jgi:hypothetical protein
MKRHIPLAMLLLLATINVHAEEKAASQQQLDKVEAIEKIEQYALKLSSRSPDEHASRIADEALSDISEYKSYGRGLKQDEGAIKDVLTDTENLSKTIKYYWRPDTPIFRCYSDYEICKVAGYAWTTCGPALWICTVETMIPQAK